MKYTEEILALVQQAAVHGDPAAVCELGRRYAQDDAPHKTQRHRDQLALQYTRGWDGIEPDPYFWKGGNFAAPMRSAYRKGVRDHRDLADAVLRIDNMKKAAN